MYEQADEDNEFNRPRKKVKCKCCAHINCYLNQAVIENRNLRNSLHYNSEGSQVDEDIKKNPDLRI